MAGKKAAEKPAVRETALPIHEADDGGDSRLTKGYSDNPDAPSPDSVAQVEELRDESA